MPRYTNSILTKRNLAILLAALVLAIGFLLIRAERAAAEITDADFQNALTTERLMILGMLGLVVLTWFYLKWRPPTDHGDDQSIETDHE